MFTDVGDGQWPVIIHTKPNIRRCLLLSFYQPSIINAQMGDVLFANKIID